MGAPHGKYAYLHLVVDGSLATGDGQAIADLPQALALGQLAK